MRSAQQLQPHGTEVYDQRSELPQSERRLKVSAGDPAWSLALADALEDILLEERAAIRRTDARGS